MTRARAAVDHADETVIVDAIREVIGAIRDAGPLPDFISGRLPALEGLIRMLDDEDWALPSREREQLLATFVYFCDPEDLIPDDIPGIGYLDDVIMIELLTREMRHVIDAYADFCIFRDASTGDDSERLVARRERLHARMRRRLKADHDRGRKSSLW